MPQAIAFVPADPGLPRYSTRLGGQPDWIDEPQWPVSRQAGEPMGFIGQFRLPAARGGQPALAYVFMSSDELYVGGTWNPETGENAVIVQPEGVVPSFLDVRPDAEGPTVDDVEYVPVPDPEQTDPWNASQFFGGPGVDPFWILGEAEPGPGWSLIVQLDSVRVPFFLNFGDCGYGYAFLSPDGREGRFLWQCS